jgi:hypothetical protein
MIELLRIARQSRVGAGEAVHRIPLGRLGRCPDSADDFLQQGAQLL